MSPSTMRENLDEWVIPVYALAPFIPVRGEDSRLWDQQGKEYIGFAGGTIVSALGHIHPALREALSDQANKFRYTGNGYTNELVLRLARRLIDATFAERIFFYSPGAEVNEAALKLARKHAHDRSGSQKSGIAAFKNVFHGRMLFTVSAGGQPAYSQDFTPLPPDIRHAIYNDLDSASQLVDDTTCAVIVEPVQGEGDVVPATKAFSQGLRELRDHHNALLIFDEIQTGVGHTGGLCAYMHHGVTSDLLTTVKALGGGSPIGTLLATEHCASVMTVGIHGVTYGRNSPTATVAGKLLEIVSTPEVLDEVKQRHGWLVERINAVNERFGLSSEIHGLGLLIGCMLDTESAGKAELISREAAVAGVMVLIAGANVMRSAPTFNVSEGEVAAELGRLMLACERIRVGGSS